LTFTSKLRVNIKVERNRPSVVLNEGKVGMAISTDINVARFESETGDFDKSLGFKAES